MSKPRLSVLVPVFNGQPFLSDCLDSILKQDFTDYELLISDNGSTDGTLDVLRLYAGKDARIRWWQNPANLGMGGNFNACLQAARGEFVKFVMHDDLLSTPFALRDMVAALEADPSVSLVGSPAQLIDAQSRPIGVRDTFGCPGTWDGRQVILGCLAQNANLIGEPTVVMFRRSQAERGFDGRLKHWLDLEMWFHLLEQGQFTWLDRVSCAFRRHAAQESEANRRTGASAGEWCQVLENYHARPWVRESVPPQTVFANLRYLRRNSGGKNPVLSADLQGRLSAPVYFICWLKHKLARLLRSPARLFR